MVNRTIVAILIGLLVSCLPKTDCEITKEYYKQKECIAIVTEPPIYSNKFLSNGINPYTKQKCNCFEDDRWWRNYISEISIGDTIVKRKGEMIFSIHKKGAIVNHYFECEGKIYR